MKELEDILERLQSFPESLRLDQVLLEFELLKGKVSNDELRKSVSMSLVKGFFPISTAISKLMADIGGLFSPDSVLDPFCGTGSIIEKCEYATHRMGVDKDSTSIEFASFLSANIDFRCVDFTHQTFSKQFDLVVSALPWTFKPMSSKQSEEPIDIRIIRKSLSLIAPQGTAVFLVPHSFLTRTDRREFRRELLNDNSLFAIVEVHPENDDYTSMRRALIIFRKTEGARKVYQSEVNKGNLDQIIEDLKNESSESWIERGDFQERWDILYHSEKSRELRKILDRNNSSKLSEIAELLRGVPVKRFTVQDSGHFQLWSAVHVGPQGEAQVHVKGFTDEIQKPQEGHILKPGDIVVDLNLTKGGVKTVEDIDPPAIAVGSTAVIRSKIGDYIVSFLKSGTGKEVMKHQMKLAMTGTVTPSISFEKLKNIQIPILPFDDLNDISNGTIEVATELELVELESKLRQSYQILNEQSTDLSIVKEPQSDYGAIHLDGPKSLHLILQKESSTTLKFIATQLHLVLQNQADMKKSIGSIAEMMISLDDRVGKIKGLSRDEEGKISRLERTIDELIAKTSKAAKDLDFYKLEIQKWFDHWEELDDASRKFLPVAEFLLDQLDESNSPDYSPFILQYCRVLENELKKKLFESYHTHLSSTLSDKQLTELTSQQPRKAQDFARIVLRNELFKYTLGAMNKILLKLDMAAEEQSSTLLSDFQVYVLRYYNVNVLEKKYLESISNITKNYRNRSAHASVMSVVQAKECQLLVQAGLKQLFENRLKD